MNLLTCVLETLRSHIVSKTSVTLRDTTSEEVKQLKAENEQLKQSQGKRIDPLGVEQ